MINALTVPSDLLVVNKNLDALKSVTISKMPLINILRMRMIIQDVNLIIRMIISISEISKHLNT